MDSLKTSQLVEQPSHSKTVSTPLNEYGDLIRFLPYPCRLTLLYSSVFLRLNLPNEPLCNPLHIWALDSWTLRRGVHNPLHPSFSESVLSIRNKLPCHFQCWVLLGCTYMIHRFSGDESDEKSFTGPHIVLTTVYRPLPSLLHQLQFRLPKQDENTPQRIRTPWTFFTKPRLEAPVLLALWMCYWVHYSWCT